MKSRPVRAGTPRIANRLLKRVRDFARLWARGRDYLDAARKALKKLEVDELGLDTIDRRMLKAMITRYGGEVGRSGYGRGVNRRGSNYNRGRVRAVSYANRLSRTPRGGLSFRARISIWELNTTGN